MIEERILMICSHDYICIITYLSIGNCMEKPTSIIEWHKTNPLERVTLDGEKDYYSIPKGENMGGHLDTICKHANVEGWGVIDSADRLLIPTYAYDRILVANLPGAGTVPTLRCSRCEHAWHPRSQEMPERCPKCNSPYWNKPRVRNERK
jgi:hypothetical protein